MTDAYTMTLTGHTTGTVVSGDAAPMSNGSYLGVLTFTIQDSYDLTITLDSGSQIMSSPLTNKILVVPSLVQAAYTHLETSLSTLVAGVTYEFTIEAMDIFSNVVLGSTDWIQYEISSVERPDDTYVLANMTYEFHLHRAVFHLPLKGNYLSIVKVTQKGGLIATFYETVDWSSPVLLESLHVHSAAVGADPYIVSSTTGDHTHFTRIDPTIDYDIGQNCTLVDLIPAPVASYPTRYFSVIWKGYLVAPRSALYRIHVETDESAYH